MGASDLQTKSPQVHCLWQFDLLQSFLGVCITVKKHKLHFYQHYCLNKLLFNQIKQTNAANLEWGSISSADVLVGLHVLSSGRSVQVHKGNTIHLQCREHWAIIDPLGYDFRSRPD